MDIEADMVIVFVSHKTEWFTFRKSVHKYECQNQKLKIPIVVFYDAPDV